MKEVNLVVLVSEGHLNRFIEVAEECRKAGLRIENEMASIGLIVGTIDAARADDLRAIAGVADVQPSSDLQLPPHPEDAR
jgi:glutamate/tyrosine decarboxylase-like PLP-dependent enzyme